MDRAGGASTCSTGYAWESEKLSYELGGLRPEELPEDRRDEDGVREVLRLRRLSSLPPFPVRGAGAKGCSSMIITPRKPRDHVVRDVATATLSARACLVIRAELAGLAVLGHGGRPPSVSWSSPVHP